MNVPEVIQSGPRNIFDTPFRLIDTLILASLSRSPKHGYVLDALITNVSLGRIMPGKAAIYKVLRRLQREGLVQELTGASSRRREYDITPAGRSQLGRDLALLRRTLQAFDDRLV